MGSKYESPRVHKFVGPELHKTGYPWIVHLSDCGSGPVCRVGKARYRIRRIARYGSLLHWSRCVYTCDDQG